MLRRYEPWPRSATPIRKDSSRGPRRCASSRAHYGADTIATINGGTDVRKAPAADYFAHVLLPLLPRIGARVDFAVVKRGYYPAGGGEVRVAVEPSVLRPVALDRPGDLVAIEGLAHVADLPLDIALRMRDAALRALAAVPGSAPRIETCLLSNEAAFGHGGAIAVWARTENSVLGASRVAERGVRAAQRIRRPAFRAESDRAPRARPRWRGRRRGRRRFVRARSHALRPRWHGTEQAAAHRRVPRVSRIQPLPVVDRSLRAAHTLFPAPRSRRSPRGFASRDRHRRQSYRRSFTVRDSSVGMGRKRAITRFMTCSCSSGTK